MIDRATAQVSLLRTCVVADPADSQPMRPRRPSLTRSSPCTACLASCPSYAVRAVCADSPLISPADYLVVVTARTLVADVLGTPVYAAKDFSVFPLDRSPTVALLAHPDEAYLLGLLKTHLFSAPFYFTYGGYNLTQRLQEQVLRDPAKPFFETVRCPFPTRAEQDTVRRALLLEQAPPDAPHRRPQREPGCEFRYASRSSTDATLPAQPLHPPRHVWLYGNTVSPTESN